MKQSRQKKSAKQNDVDYAFISISLGAASLFTFLLTAIPAIVTGIVALRRRSGNPAQAKWGIALGVVSILIGIALMVALVIGISKLSKPKVEEQQSIPTHIKQELEQATDALQHYHTKTGFFPECSARHNTSGCPHWERFTQDSGVTLSQNLIFSENATISPQEPGTLVYAYGTICLINSPIGYDFLSEDKSDQAERDKYVALVYYHENGTSCFSATADR